MSEQVRRRDDTGIVGSGGGRRVWVSGGAAVLRSRQSISVPAASYSRPGPHTILTHAYMHAQLSLSLLFTHLSVFQ